MKYVFDLDGTLIDSYDAVHHAYFKAGVVMPIDAFGKPWREWLPGVCESRGLNAEEVHRIKNECYPEFIHKVKRTPLFETLLHKQMDPIVILTGASGRAVDAAFHARILTPACVVRGRAMSREDKAQWLSVRLGGLQGAYVDDDPIARNIVAGTGWRVLSPDEALDELI